MEPAQTVADGLAGFSVPLPQRWILTPQALAEIVLPERREPPVDRLLFVADVENLTVRTLF